MLGFSLYKRIIFIYKRPCNKCEEGKKSFYKTQHEQSYEIKILLTSIVCYILCTGNSSYAIQLSRPLFAPFEKQL